MQTGSFHCRFCDVKTKAQWSGRTTPTIGDVMFCGVTTGFLYQINSHNAGFAISVVVTPIELIKARYYFMESS